MKRPEWATAKVRMHLATCWYGEHGDETILCGVHWWDDVLMTISTWIHNMLVAPFDDRGFHLYLIETYCNSGSKHE